MTEMVDRKDDLLGKAEAYQRRMRQAHAQRLADEVADLTSWLKREAAEAERSTATLAAAHLPAPKPEGEENR